LHKRGQAARVVAVLVRNDHAVEFGRVFADMACRRLRVSRPLKPQSTSTRVSPATSSVALPELPLLRMQMRMDSGELQVKGQGWSVSK
jgi:hypothetical protein